MIPRGDVTSLLLLPLLIKKITPSACHITMTDDALYRASSCGADQVLAKKIDGGTFLVPAVYSHATVTYITWNLSIINYCRIV